ncbi:uncharacterized protein RpL6 isoform X2 [Bemisia tabaci]|uniref:uncharacterized protein RpL6 isoform X2 n=1 Tax=Bemisia tabaci TaxID=7038 RepID=UPI003B280ECF
MLTIMADVEKAAKAKKAAKKPKADKPKKASDAPRKPRPVAKNRPPKKPLVLAPPPKAPKKVKAVKPRLPGSEFKRQQKLKAQKEKEKKRLDARLKKVKSKKATGLKKTIFQLKSKNALPKGKKRRHQEKAKYRAAVELAVGKTLNPRLTEILKTSLFKIQDKKFEKEITKDRERSLEKRSPQYKLYKSKKGKVHKVWLQKTKKVFNIYNSGREVKRAKTRNYHLKRFRPSLKRGSVLILLSGLHKAKRVILLKTLSNGLLLVTGPHKLNKCPIRRVHQNYVIGTSTRLDISKVRIPKHINNEYFRRINMLKKKTKKETKKTEGELFVSEEQKYKPSEQRKKDQEYIDNQILEVIKKHKDKKFIYGYLSSMFRLQNRQFPHRMNF